MDSVDWVDEIHTSTRECFKQLSFIPKRRFSWFFLLVWINSKYETTGFIYWAKGRVCEIKSIRDGWPIISLLEYEQTEIWKNLAYWYFAFEQVCYERVFYGIRFLTMFWDIIKHKERFMPQLCKILFKAWIKIVTL